MTNPGQLGQLPDLSGKMSDDDALKKAIINVTTAGLLTLDEKLLAPLDGKIAKVELLLDLLKIGLNLFSRRLPFLISSLSIAASESKRSERELLADEEIKARLTQIQHIAEKTHQQEKLKLICNALVSNACGAGRDADSREGFFRLLEALTLTEIELLNMLQLHERRISTFESMTAIYEHLKNNGLALSAMEFRIQFATRESNFLALKHDIADLPNLATRVEARVIESSATRGMAVTDLGLAFLAFVRKHTNP
jgi:hypothetical protein